MVGNPGNAGANMGHPFVLEQRPRIGFVSLGCPKNLVDSEVMMGLLDQAGAEITNRPETADILVVNTCSFIDKAKQESIDTILQMAQHKVSGRRAS
jgi:ribosomal protein S12 methylthiotransferase